MVSACAKVMLARDRSRDVSVALVIGQPPTVCCARPVYTGCNAAHRIAVDQNIEHLPRRTDLFRSAVEVHLMTAVNAAHSQHINYS